MHATNRGVRRKALAAVTVAIVLAVAAAVLLTVARPADSGDAGADPLPRDGVEAVLGLFSEYRLVAIAESHGLSEQEAFVRRLVRDPRFARRVGTVVLESGNARFQHTVDRYVNGGPVQPRELSRAWRDHFGSLGMVSGPLRLLQTIRRANASLPADQRIHVLLADPPIRWNTIRSRRQLASFTRAWDRERFYANVVLDEVLAKGRKALLIAGGFHFNRVNAPGAWTAGSLIERHRSGGLFVIAPHLDREIDSGLDAWPRFSLARVHGTWLGRRALDPVPWRAQPLRAEETYDGYLYLGPVADLSLTLDSPLVWRDDALFEEFLRRRRLAFGPHFRAEQMMPPTDARYPIDLGEVLSGTRSPEQGRAPSTEDTEGLSPEQDVLTG